MGRISRRNFLVQVGAASAAGFVTRRARLETPHASVRLRAELASDPLRPQFHLLPKANWMNDPNGPLFANGRYHMFYQYNPAGAFWGSMHWAHASSPDMIHWRHEPIALAPTPGGYDRDGVFSGSTVLDHGVPTIVYTGVEPPTRGAEATLRGGGHTWREVQCLAVSHDGFETWQKESEPVIARPPEGLAVTGFRDPCLWREDRDWMMALGSGVRGRGGAILLYRSRDLWHWAYVHMLAEGEASGPRTPNPVDNGEMWECPDFFPLGDRYVLLISTMGKVLWKVGTYSENRFHPEREGTVDFGAFYAEKSMLDRDGNRVLWGWIPERRPEKEYRAAGWAGVIGLPRVLSLGPERNLRIEPAPAIEILRESYSRSSAPISNSKAQGLLAELRIHNLAAEVRVEFTPERACPFLMQLLAESGEPFAEVGYEPGQIGREFRMNGTHAALLTPANRPLNLRLFIDGSVLELFANGTTTITERVYTVPHAPLRVALQGAPSVRSVEVWQMRPISRDRLTS